MGKTSEGWVPNSYVGLGDHPLDAEGDLDGPNIFKQFDKTANCIVELESARREGNSFFFAARGFQVYTQRKIQFFLEYQTQGSPWQRITLRLDFLRADAFRLRAVEGETVPEHATDLVIGDLADPRLTVVFQETPDRFILKSPKLKLTLFKQDFRIEIFDGRGRRLTESGGRMKNAFPNAQDSWPTGFVADQGSGMSFAVENWTLNPGEATYGLGERFASLNRRGQTLGLWTKEGMGNTMGRTYKPIPFFLSTQGYGIFVNESLPMNFWVGSRHFPHMILAVEGRLLDYYFFYGPSFKKILRLYTDLTGRGPVPPKWSFGLWVSRISYGSQEEVLGVAKRLREEKWPSDVIHIDTNWFKTDWECDWEFAPDRFPDPKAMFRQCRDQGFRVSLWQFPYVMKKLPLYQDGLRRGAFAGNDEGFAFTFKPMAMIDFSKPEGVEWYQERWRKLFQLGAACIKADFGEWAMDRMTFARGDGRRMHNLYPLLYNKAAFEVTAEFFPQPVIWARSAYAGSQRYPLHWSGDNSSSFENMLCSLRGGLSLGLCGFSFWSNDVGGFIGVPDDKLYTRWVQFGIFNSHMRLHGCPPKFREPWNFSPETQAIVRRMLELRYRLIPYLYTEATHAAGNGLPVMAPLCLEFQDDPTTWNIEDQFLFGRSILVAPILTEDDERRIYFPEGAWHDHWTGRRYPGKQWISYRCPLSRVPFFYREGTVIPLGPVMQHTGEKPLDPLTLKVFPDARGRAQGELVEEPGRAVKLRAALLRGELAVTARLPARVIEVDLPPQSRVKRVRLNGRSLEMERASPSKKKSRKRR